MREMNTIIYDVADERLTADSAERFRQGLYEAIQALPSAVVLNMENVKSIDSYCLGTMVLAAKILPPGCKLYIAAPQPQLAELFGNLHLDQVLGIRDTVSEAVSDADEYAEDTREDDQAAGAG